MAGGPEGAGLVVLPHPMVPGHRVWSEQDEGRKDPEITELLYSGPSKVLRELGECFGSHVSLCRPQLLFSPCLLVRISWCLQERGRLEMVVIP